MDSQGSAHAGVRDRVIVQIKAHIGRLADRNGLDLMGRKGVVRQGQKTLALLGKGVTDRQRFIFRATALTGRSGGPGVRLDVEIIHILEATAGEEGIADVTDGTLDAPLLVSPGNRHRPWLKAIVTGQCQERRVEANDRTLAFQYRALQIVIQRDSRTAAPGSKGIDMAAQEVLHVGAEVKAQEDLARPGQDGDESHQGTPGVADVEVAEVSPVDLALFARQGAQAQVGLALRPGPMTGDQVPEVIWFAGITPILDHLIEPTGTQARELGQSFADERQVRINGRSATGRR